MASADILRSQTNTAQILKCVHTRSQLARSCAKKLIVGAAAGVTGIYRHFETQRSLEKELYGNATTFRRSMPKVGRNDPCPCGSGRKFKQCCGNPTLH